MQPQDQAKNFFNSIASAYKGKYTPDQPFHYYFFTERLYEASRNIDIDGKAILDIGAGTGDLYDYLVANYKSVKYNASDVAAEMLANSHIPRADYCVGNIYDTDFKIASYDRAFMLGVTTYLNAAELDKNFAHIHQLLKKDSLFILTFTNRNSFDWKMRAVLKFFVRLLGNKSRVLAQVNIYPLNEKEARNLLEKYFEVQEIRWLNHTVFPWSVLLRKPSVWLARKMHSGLQQSVFSSLLSSDFLLIAKPK